VSESSRVLRLHQYMEFIAKIAFFGATTISTILLGIFFLGNLFTTVDSTKQIILLVSGLTASAMLAWAIRLGYFDGQFLAGFGFAVASVVVFAVMMIAGIFAFTNIHWQ
jgi:hypothetical protein